MEVHHKWGKIDREQNMRDDLRGQESIDHQERHFISMQITTQGKVDQTFL